MELQRCNHNFRSEYQLKLEKESFPEKAVTVAQQTLEKFKDYLNVKKEIPHDDALQIMHDALSTFNYPYTRHSKILRVILNIAKIKDEFFKEIKWENRAYLSMETKDSEIGNILFFCPFDQSPYPAIQQIASLYAQAYLTAIKNDKVKDFEQQVFNHDNFYHNVTELCDWIIEGQETYLNFNLSPQADLHYNLGVFCDLFMEIQFRTYYEDRFHEVFDKTNEVDLKIRTHFNWKGEFEQAREKWFTLEKFLKFMRDNPQFFPIPYKDGKITLKSLEADVKLFQEVCDIF